MFRLVTFGQTACGSTAADAHRLGVLPALNVPHTSTEAAPQAPSGTRQCRHQLVHHRLARTELVNNVLVTQAGAVTAEEWSRHIETQPHHAPRKCLR